MNAFPFQNKNLSRSLQELETINSFVVMIQMCRQNNNIHLRRAIDFFVSSIMKIARMFLINDIDKFMRPSQITVEKLFSF